MRILSVAAILCSLSACGHHHAAAEANDGGAHDAAEPAALDATESSLLDASLAPDADAPVSDDAGLALDSGSESLDAAESPDATESLDAAEPPDAAASDDAGAPDASAGLDAGEDPPDAAEAFDGSVLVRVMAANLSTGNKQSYDPGEGLRLIEGSHPDVVLIQEFNYGNDSAAAIQQMVTDTLGSDFTYCRGAGSGGGTIPNGVISRWPIVTCAGWTDPQVGNRDFTYARIELPGARELWAVSLHLLTTNASDRNAEATSLIKSIQATVPAGAYLTVGGDLNTDAVSEACISTFSAALVAPGARPADQNANSNTSGNRSRPHDYVFASPALDALQVPTVIGSSSYSQGLVLDSRIYTPLSEIAPAQLGDSGAPGMQHMGVLKDFLLP